MRSLTLLRFALAVLIVAPITSLGDEFNIYDAGSSGQSFELSDSGGAPQMQMPPTMSESYPDPVVDQPQAPSRVGPGAQVSATHGSSANQYRSRPGGRRRPMVLRDKLFGWRACSRSLRVSTHSTVV